TRRARDIGPLSSAPGPAGSTGGLAPGMTFIGQERPGGHAPAPPAHGEPGPAIPSQGPVEPVTAGPGDPGPASGGLSARDLDAGDLPPRSRGVIGLLEENCTVCMLCARECPDWCIYIESHKQTVPAPDSGRPRVRNVLDRFAIDFSLCMY